MKARFQLDQPAARCRAELRRQFALIQDLEKTTAAGQVEALHDLRVALRRLRVLLRALAGMLEHTASAEVERRWQSFADQLSPLRDADVWRGLLRALPGVTPAFRRRVHARLRRERGRPAAVLRSPAWARLKRETKKLLTRQLPAALAKAGEKQITSALQHAWEQARARAAKLVRNRQLAKVEPAHKLRIACRRVRYLADFLALVVEGRKNRQAWQLLAGDYRALQNALGRTHDADVLLEFLHEARLRPPAVVTRDLRRRRARGVRQFKKLWRGLGA